MTTALPELWTLIGASRPQGDELVGRQVAPDVTLRLLAAVDSRGRRHILIKLDPGDEPCRDGSSRGLTVVTDDLALGGSGVGRYIDIACEDAIGHPMLDIVAGELAQRLIAGGSPPNECVSRVLAKWRRFWGQLPRQLLSQEAQIGLFAELWFLTYWLIPAVGISQAVGMWRGPHGSRHDFERTGLSVEAKGTTSTRGRVHCINGIQQLEPPERGALFFFSLRLREEAGAKNTLPVLCRACREQVARDPDAEGTFDTALIAAGYLPTHEEEYSRLHLRVVEELLFRVADGFPRIVTNTFSDRPPPGVEELQYQINLGTFEDYVVSRAPAEALKILFRGME